MTDSHKAPAVDIAALAALARLEVTPEEITKLEQEIPEILEFVTTIQKASSEAPKIDTTHRNVMREDANPHEGGLYTEDLLAAAPERKGNAIAVRQVVSRKK